MQCGVQSVRYSARYSILNSKWKIWLVSLGRKGSKARSVHRGILVPLDCKAYRETMVNLVRRVPKVSLGLMARQD